MSKRLTAKEARELSIKSEKYAPDSCLVGRVLGAMLSKIRSEAKWGHTQQTFLCRSLPGLINLSYSERVTVMGQVANKLEELGFRCNLCCDCDNFTLIARVEWWHNDQRKETK